MSNKSATLDRQTDSYNHALKILVCYHKNYTMIPQTEDKIFLPIQCGKALTDLDLGIQTDNLCNGKPCDNISEKNPYYSELTAVYWAWKNIKTLYPGIKYVGLFHYRRFLAFDERKFFTEDIIKSEREIINYKVDSRRIVNILESGKIIMPKKRVFPFSTKDEYSTSHVSEDVRTVEKIIENQFPEYYPAFITLMNGNKVASRNMFIMKYDEFCEYCEWLFTVIDEINKQINYTSYYSSYQRRMPGFMSERLFNVYLLTHGKRLKFFNILYFEGEQKPPRHKIRHKICWFVIEMFGYWRDEFTAWLLRSRWKFASLLVKIKKKITREN